MSDKILNSLLKEYEQKKIYAEMEAEKRKEEFYKKIPKLQQIENELNAFAILTTKNILSNQTVSLDEMNEKIKLLKQKKETILQENGISLNDLKPHYECSICEDTGYVSQKNLDTKMCNCLKQKLLNASFDKSNLSNLNKENFDTFNEDLFSDEVDLAKFRFNISPKENIRNIKQKCKDFIENFDLPDTKNLLFTGNTGLR